VDRRERFIHLVIEALGKARELRIRARPESKAKAAGLMERVQKSQKDDEGTESGFCVDGRGLRIRPRF